MMVIPLNILQIIYEFFVQVDRRNKNQPGLGQVQPTICTFQFRTSNFGLN